ncbi:MAG: NAD(P)-dependent oxidoreductase [Proteobacteria bacterium]|nr:NAD(P)-dependent oxidoreductase [Pseudomonadota bacterium]
MTRALVTGASGFIGRHSLAALVERGYEVHAVARGAGTVPATVGVTAHACDLFDDRAMAALVERVHPTHLLHFAWYAVPGRFWTAPENLDWVAASLRLVRTFAAAGGRRVVIAGSCAEYDWSHATLSEIATPLAPRTLYGTAKDALRRCLEQAAPSLGLSWAWGRIFFVYGPHEPLGRLISSLLDDLLAGRRAAVTAGTQLRDFMHAEDVARAFVATLDSAVEGSLNIASGEAVAVREVVARLGTLTGRSTLIDFGARPTPADEPPCLAADIPTLLDTVGFTPRYGLANGLERTVEWWRGSRPT